MYIYAHTNIYLYLAQVKFPASFLEQLTFCWQEDTELGTRRVEWVYYMYIVKSSTSEPVPFQEHVHKSNLFINPTKLT